MFNLEDNELLTSMKKEMEKKEKEVQKRKPKKKIIPKESNLKKGDFDDLKEHFLNSDEESYDEEFERFKAQNLKNEKSNKKSELDENDFEKYFNTM